VAHLLGSDHTTGITGIGAATGTSKSDSDCTRSPGPYCIPTSSAWPTLLGSDCTTGMSSVDAKGGAQTQTLTRP